MLFRSVMVSQYVDGSLIRETSPSGGSKCTVGAMLGIKELHILIWETCRNRRRIRLDFLRFLGRKGRGLGWGDGFVPDGVSGWILCRLAGKMGSFGKKWI